MPSSDITSPNNRKRRLEHSESVHVAFQGMQYSYTFLAAKSFFTDYTSNLDYRSKQSLKEVMESVKSGECHYGLVPLESSSYGTIHGVYDRLLASDGQLVIIGEIGQIEHHALCVRGNQTSVAEVDIDTVVSHPHILECCSDYLDRIDAKRHAQSKPVIKRIASWDTAAACAQVAESTEENVAAICSKEAATHYHMRILEQTVGSDLNAETRYIAISRSLGDNAQVSDPLGISFNQRSPRAGAAALRNKCSIALALRNTSGAIFKMSSCFAFRNIDISKIESRPATVAMQLPSLANRPFTQRHWDLIFYLDYEPSDSSEVNAALRTNLMEYCLWIRDLGTYRSGMQAVESQPSAWTQMVDVLSC